MMDLWLPIAACGMITLARLLVEWRGRIRYEHVRAATVAALLRFAPAGAILQDLRRDGTLLHIEIPAGQTPEVRGSTRQLPERPTC